MSNRSLPLPGPVESPPQSVRPDRQAWLPTRPAWFAGIDTEILNEVKSEWTRWDTLGILIAVMCCLGGISAALAVGLVLARPALEFFWVGIVWTCVLICVERVILQMPSAGRWWATLGAICWRVALSLAIAGLITEPLILRFSEKEITAQVRQEVRQGKERAAEEVRNDIHPLLAKAHTELAKTRARKADLESKLSADEAQIANAIENGNSAGRIAAEGHAALHSHRLGGAIERNGHRQPALREEIRHLSSATSAREGHAEHAIEEGVGFQARLAALAGVIKKWPNTSDMVWLLRVAFILLDLTPLIAVLAYRAWRGKKPYELRLEAYRESDALPAFRMREAVRVEERRIKEEARRDMRINQARISGEADREIFGTTDTGSVYSGTEGGQRMPLDEFAGHLEDVNRRPVAVPEVLRRRTWMGFACLAVGTAIALALSTVTSVGCVWLLAICTCLAAGLCLYTRGFRQAPVWAMRPLLATFVGGFALPFVVLILNII